MDPQNSYAITNIYRTDPGPTSHFPGANPRRRVNRLAEALSEESGSSDLHEAIKSIATSLMQIKEDGANLHVMLGRLAPSVAQAAQDAVFMAMGDGVDIPPEAPT
jgi:hypothetical protein